MPKSLYAPLSPMKKKAIHVAAFSEFSERPYAKASINQIVKKAGIARGSFYLYYEDKMDIYIHTTEILMNERTNRFLRMLEGQALARRQAFENAPERLALQVLHRDVKHVGRVADVVNPDNVGMGHFARDARFVEKARYNDLVLAKLWQQRFQRDVFAQGIIVDLVNATHPAPANEVQHRIPARDDLSPAKLDGLFLGPLGRRPVCRLDLDPGELRLALDTMLLPFRIHIEASWALYLSHRCTTLPQRAHSEHPTLRRRLCLRVSVQVFRSQESEWNGNRRLTTC